MLYPVHRPPCFPSTENGCKSVVLGTLNRFNLNRLRLKRLISKEHDLTVIHCSLEYKKYIFQVLEIARSVTNQTNNDTAKDFFINRLNESDMYFTDKPIPANESDENAHNLCSSAEGAMKYCPKRWEAIQNWFAEARKVISSSSESKRTKLIG